MTGYSGGDADRAEKKRIAFAAWRPGRTTATRKAFLTEELVAESKR